MIIWCSYCQAFLRESPPFDDPAMSHGICESCVRQFEAGELVPDRSEEAREVVTRMLDCAWRSETSAIPSLVDEARRHGLSKESVLMGMLQPALYRVGKAWQSGTLSIAEEHRFTMWCDLFLAHLTAGTTASEPVDVLILMSPGNMHTLGPRFAAELLTARGIACRVVVPGLPLADAVAEIERIEPLVVGFSCALPSELSDADAFIGDICARLEARWRGVMMICGLAVRGAAASWTSANGALAAVTLEDVERIVADARARAGRPALVLPAGG